MLRGIYVPTDFESNDLDPNLTAEQKLEIIGNSPITITPLVVRGVVHDAEAHLRLPYTDVFEIGIVHGDVSHERIFTDYVNVGDKALYGRGIGARLLRAACRYAIDRYPKVSTFETGWARLGLVNTAVKVFGEENVAIIQGANKRYGWEGQQPLDAIFDVKPVRDGKPYIVGSIQARIDHDQAKAWEQPVYQLPTNT